MLAPFFKNANKNEHFGEVGSFAVFPFSLLAKHKVASSTLVTRSLEAPAPTGALSFIQPEGAVSLFSLTSQRVPATVAL